MPGENTETLSTEKWTLPFQDPFPIPSWATSRKIDPKSGLVLDICSCGVSHPNEDWLAEFDPNNDFRLNEHPCCPRECCKIRSGRKKLRKKTRRST